MSNTPSIQEADVRVWLEANPDFLSRHPDLLAARGEASAKVHQLGDARLASMEKELSGCRKHLDHLLEQIRRNEEIYNNFHHLEMRMITAPDLGELVNTVCHDMERIFAIHRVTLALSNGMDSPGALLGSQVPEALAQRLFLLDQETVKQAFGESPKVLIRVGQEGANRERFFGAVAGDIRSEALVPLFAGPPVFSGPLRMIGSLNLGGSVPSRFLPGYSTDLLENLAEILALCLHNVLK
ncbi:MAG: DUF484 family protein [Magnetococcales bacterium]|nr:DUF484 family protein [Magnetococcales bacterium]